MWSSPVTGSQTLANFSPLTSTNRYYTYNGVTNLYNNIDPLTTSFDDTNRGKGFLIRMPDNSSADTPTAYEGVFTGVPNNGTITLSGLTPDTFYSVGNPYPNTLNANSFLSGNSTGETLYFWRKTNGAGGSAYATWNSAGGTASGVLHQTTLFLRKI
jgi:hypothetical protein